MNKNLKLLVSIGTLVLLFGGAFLLYHNLGDKLGGGSNLGTFAPEVTVSPTPEASESTSTSTGTSSNTTAGSSTGTDTSESQEETGAQTRPAPDFTFYDIDGKSKTLYSYVGKPIVMNFWASWCPPCKEEMPDFQKVYEELGEDVQFLMIDVVDGQRETVELGQAFIDSNEFTFPVFFDTDYEGSYKYGISSIPSTYFIDSDGHMVAYARGMINEASLRQGILMIQGD